MDKARVTIGRPELERMAKGKEVIIRLRPGTILVGLTLSLMAQSEIQKKPKDFFAYLADLGLRLPRQ